MSGGLLRGGVREGRESIVYEINSAGREVDYLLLFLPKFFDPRSFLFSLRLKEGGWRGGGEGIIKSCGIVIER